MERLSNLYISHYILYYISHDELSSPARSPVSLLPDVAKFQYGKENLVVLLQSHVVCSLLSQRYRTWHLLIHPPSSTTFIIRFQPTALPSSLTHSPPSTPQRRSFLLPLPLPRLTHPLSNPPKNVFILSRCQRVCGFLLRYCWITDCDVMSAIFTWS